MRDKGRTRTQLIDELNELRRKIAELEKSEEERKRLEEALRYSEERRALIWSVTPDFVAVIDREMTFCQINKSMAQMFGKQPEELIGTCGLDLLPAELAETRRHCFEEVFRTGQTVRWEDSNRGNYFDSVAFPIGEENGQVTRVTLVARDITKRRQAEEALKESEEKHRELAESITDVYFAMDENLRYTYWNRASEELTGIRAEDAIGKHLYDIFPDTQNTREAESVYRRVLCTGEPQQFINEYEIKDKTYFFEINAYPSKNGLSVFVKDITKRKQAQEALQESEENLRSYLEYAPIGIILTTLEGDIIYANRRAVEMSGYSKEELLGKKPLELGLISKSGGMEISEAIPVPEKTSIDLPIELELTTKGNVNLWVEFTATTIRHLSGEIFVICFIRDITRRKMEEEEQRKIERLESVGTLAGGIAHDFNNLLTGIMGNIGLAKRRIEPGEKAYERLEEAENASLRARDLTQQLLTFSSGGAPVKQVVSIGKIVEESTRFTMRGSNVRCEFTISDNILPVEADESQIGQVISNLVLNASQAMPDGGTIDIGVDNTTIKRGSSLPLSVGKYVKITVQDYGIGIPAEYLPRIFDPYFTTKQKGSGLGLATAYSIIKNHDGHISVDSTHGVGTTVCVYLPASRKHVRVPKKPVIEKPVVREGRILIMDDEAVIRELLQDVLTGSGYGVELTKDGTEAVEEYRKAREAGRPFDVVIIDLTVPGGMGGKEAIEKLLEIDPEVKAIVTSGYSNDTIMSDFARYGFRDVVAKPFKITELEEKLRDLMAN